ncbi:hypothetical protein M8818_002023 [Zalaria obscura]|uniref:Uncharacterized protein n=1 Tax=Zalaria obscura TaxID=2024903 RepID=A0ACC3SIT7_9PEZI
MEMLVELLDLGSKFPEQAGARQFSLESTKRQRYLATGQIDGKDTTITSGMNPEPCSHNPMESGLQQ